jgi:hypothetical protein
MRKPPNSHEFGYSEPSVSFSIGRGLPYGLSAACLGGCRTRMKFQFDIFSLFVLTTVVAMGCAIVVSPIPTVAKGMPIFALAICYYGWLIRNYKYPDPRKPQPMTRRMRISMYLTPVVLETVVVIYLLRKMPRAPQYSWLWYSAAAFFSASTLVRLWLAFKPDPRTQPVPAP